MSDQTGDPSVELATAYARVRVGEQILATLTETTYGGSRNVLALRLRSVLEAESEGDLLTVRAGLLELAIAAAAWAASVDASLPAEETLVSRRLPRRRDP